MGCNLDLRNNKQIEKFGTWVWLKALGLKIKFVNLDLHELQLDCNDQIK